MTNDTIIDSICREISTGTLSVEDVLIGINKLFIEEIKNAILSSGGKISFKQNFPRLISCCFSQVLELDVKEVWLDNDLFFGCKDPETDETYQLGVEDFLIGELRHVVDKIKE